MSEQISLKEIDGMLENQQVDNQADSNVTKETPKETVTFSLADIDAMLDEGEKKPDYAAAKKASDALNGTGSVAKQPTAKTEQKVEQKQAEPKKTPDGEFDYERGEQQTYQDPRSGKDVATQTRWGKGVVEVEAPYASAVEDYDTGTTHAITPSGQSISQTSTGSRGQVVSDSEITGTNIGGDNERVLVGWKFPGSSYSRLNLIPQGGIDWVKRNPNAYKEQLAELQGKSVQDAVGMYNKLAKGMDDLARVNPDSDTMARLYAIQEYVHAKDLGYIDNTDMRKDGQRYIYYNSYNGSPEIKALMDSGQRFRVDDYLTKAKIAVQSHPLKSVVDIQGAIGELFTPQDKALAWVTAMDNWKRGEASSIEKEYQRLLAEPLKQLHDEIVDRAADPSTAEYVFRSMGFGNDIVNAVLWAGRKLTGTSDKQGTLDLLREGNQKAQLDKFADNTFLNGAAGGLTMVANWAPAFASGYTTNAVMKGLGMSSGTMARIAGSSMLGKITRGAAFGSVNLPLFTYYDTVFDVFQNPQSGLGDVVSSFFNEETVRHALAEAPTGAVLSPMAVLGEAFGRAVFKGNKYAAATTGFLGESLAFAGSSSIKKWMEVNERRKKGEDVSFSMKDVWDCTFESVGTLLAMKAGHWGMNGLQGRANTMKNAKGEKVDTEQRKSGADQFGNQGMTELSAFLYNPRQYAKEHGITDSTDMRSTALGKEWESFLSRYQKGEVKDVDANSVATAMWLIDGKAMLKPISYSTELSADGKTVFSYDSMGNLIEERSFKNREKAEKWQEELRYDAEKYDMAKLEAEAAQRENEMAMQKTLDTMFDEVADQIPSTLANGEPDPNFNVNTRTEIYNIVANTKSALFILNNAKNLPAELASQYRRMVTVGTPFMERYDQLMAANRESLRNRDNEGMLRDKVMKIIDKKPSERTAEEHQFMEAYRNSLREKFNETPYVGTAIIDGVEVYVKNDPSQNDKVYYQSADGSVKVVPSGEAMDFKAINPSIDPVREQLESLALQNREAIEAAKKEAQAKAEAEAQANQQEIEEKKKNAPVIDVQQPEQPEPKVDGSETPSPSTETLQETQAETPEPPKEEKSEASPEGKIEEPKTEEEHRKVIDEEQKWLDEHQEADPAEREQHRQRKWASERALGLRDENNNVVEQTPTVEQPKESETKSPTAQTERKTEEIAPATEETPDMEITNEDLVKTTTLTEEDLADPEAGSLKRAARRKAEKQRDDAIAYSRGEIKDKPENFDYWKERLGLEEPKAENEMQPVEIETQGDNDSETVSPITETARNDKQGELAFGEETPEQREAREKQERVDQAASLRNRHAQLSEEIKQKQLEYRFMNDRKKQYQARKELEKLYDEIEGVEQQLKDTGEPMQVKRFERPAKKERTQHAARKAYDEMKKKYANDDEVMEILNNTDPQDIYEEIGVALGSSKLLFKSKGEGASRKRGIADETGWKWNDVKGMFQLFDNEKGQSVQNWAETFWADLDEGAKNRYSSTDIANMMLDVLGSASTIGDLRNIVLANRVRQAEELLEHREKEEEYWRDMERHEQEMKDTEEEAMLENIKDLAENFDEQEYYSKFADEILKAQRDDSTGSNRDLPQGERSGSGNDGRNGEAGERETAGDRDNKDNTSVERPTGETGTDSQEDGREPRRLDSQRVSQERAGLSAKEREIVNRVNAGINEAIDDLDAEIRDLEKKGDEEGAEAARLEKEMLENSREDMIDDALDGYEDLQGFKNGTRAEKQAAERVEKSLADRKAKRMRELLEKLRDPNTSDAKRRAVVRQLADLGVDASGYLEGRNEIKEIEEPGEDIETPVESLEGLNRQRQGIEQEIAGLEYLPDNTATRARRAYLEKELAEVNERIAEARNNGGREQRGGSGWKLILTPEEVALRDGLVDVMRNAGVEVITDDNEAQRVLSEANGRVMQMGTTTRRRQEQIGKYFDGRNLSEQQRLIVDVFSEKNAEATLSINDIKGKLRRTIFRQGQDSKAGVKHSVFRHYDTNVNNYTADEILFIPDIVNQGMRKQSGNKVSYSLDKNGITYTVTTQLKSNGEELFTNYYTNRKPTAGTSGASNTATQHAPQQSVSGAKLQKVVEPTNEEGEKIDNDTLFKAAKKKFGVTHDLREAGYILPDGTMLDFSGRHELFGADDSGIRGRRATDHRVISSVAYDYDQEGNEIDTGIETNMPDFIRRGAIRIDYNGGSINLATAPTPEQRNVLRRLIAGNDGDVYVDFGDGWDSDHYAEYSEAKPSQVLNDIEHYFRDGIKPSGNVQFFKTENGEVYGFVRDGKIYLDPKIANSETAVHEYTHLWSEALRKNNPKAWEQLKSELLKDKDTMDVVKKLYPELEGDALMDEVFSNFSGKRGAEKLRAEQERLMNEEKDESEKSRIARVFDRIKRALDKYWNMARDLMAGKTKGIEKLSAEDFADMALNDLLRGEKPDAEGKQMRENRATRYEKLARGYETSSRNTERRDREYAEAVEKGDTKKVQRMLEEEAERKGYSTDSSYQGSLAFNGAAPSRNGYYETKEERAKAFREREFEGEYTLGDFIDNGLDNHDLGWQIDNPIPASGRDKATLASIRNIGAVVKGGKRTIKMYRAVDGDVKEGSFRNGDWITPSREYAERHIGLQDWKSGRIIEQEVQVDDIWWDGNDINEWGYDDGNGYVYKNTENNRKLLEPTWDERGNLIPLSERFNTEKQDIRYRLGEDKKPTFYSNAERAVEGIKQNKATAEQWKAMLTKAGGIKAGEDKWMGLSEWLDENKGKSLTKDEVMQFIKDNSIEMEETTYSEAPQSFDSLKREYDQWLHDEGFDYAQEQLRERFGDDADIAFDDLGGELVIANEKAAAALLGSDDIINQTRLDYTTEGLENKREIAFVVPGVEPYQESDSIHFGPENQGKAVMWVRFGETTDADGKRVLVIDEIQSNRHQDAREKGYISNELSKKLEETEAKISQTENELRDLTKAFDTKYGGAKEWHKTIEVKEAWGRNYKLVADEGKLTKEEYSKLNELQEERDSLITQKRQIQEQKAMQDGVPAAPFEKNWHEVAMKRMLRLAAEEGFDKVAWTTGEQQAERYNLGRAFDSIEREDNPNMRDRKRFVLSGANMETVEVNNEGMVVGSTLTGTIGKDLREVVGQSVAEKMMGLENGDMLEGEDLRIGGEGMRGFYDQILPRFMDKYGKKWGVKTGTVELPNVEEAGRTMHAVDVTPEMKESVMQGQPLFRKGVAMASQQTGHVDAVRAAVEVTNRLTGGRAKVVREADLGKDVPKNAQAWYDPNTGEVHVVAERVNGAEDASRAVWHEEIGHKAMSELLGDRYNEWLDDVHKLLGSEHADAMERLREKYAKELEGKSEEAQNRLLADEWIAELAERGEKDLSTWQKVKGMFRNWLWKHFGVMLGDGDIDYMLHKALAERRKGYRSKAMMSIAERRRAEEGNAMAEQSRRYRLLDEETRAEAKSRARDLLEAERDELNDKKTQMEDALNRALTVRRGDPSAENLAMSPKQRRELAASIERLEKRIDALNNSLAETDLTDPERVVNRAWDHVGLATEAEMLMQKAESLMKTKDIMRNAGVKSVENLTPEQRKEYDRYLWNGKIADARLTAMRDARPERPFEGSIDDNLGREPQYDDFRHPDLDRDDLSERDRDYLERQANDNYSRAKAEWNRKKERLIEQLDDYEAECDDWRMRQRDYMREIVDAEKKLRADWQTDYWSAMENNQEADALLHVADMTGIPLTSKHDVQTYLRELRYEHVRRQQHAEGEDYKFIKEIESMVDKAVGTGSLANKVRKHGDRKQVMRDLIDMMEGTKEVTEEMKPIVKKIQQWFDDMFEWQVASGLVYAPWKYRQGYVPHLWNIDASRPDADAAAKIEKAGGLVPTRMNSPFMNERFYDTYEEGIQHGLVPKHESIIDLIKEYSKEVNKAVSNRQALDILRFVKAPIETEVWVEQEGGGKKKVTQTQWLPIVIDAGEVPPKGVQYNAYKNSAFYKDGTPQFLILSPRYVKGTERNIYSMFGEQGYVSSKDAADSGLEKALGAADKAGQTVKQTNLSFSAFHAIALTEHMLGASKNPLRSTKRAIYDSLIESVITGKTLRQRKADVAEDAMSHFVKMGNSYDFDKSMDVLTKLADVINNPDNPEWKKFKQAKTDKERAKAAKSLIRTVFGGPLKLVKMLKKGNDFILWDMLHDGYKLSVWDMRSKYLRKQAEKKGWSEAELNRRLDDLGQTINDMFGGQHWELLNASPRAMRNLRLAFLSPDWNASWMRLWGRMAGMGKLRNDNFFRGLKNEEGKLQSPISGKAIKKAWKENHAQYLSMTVMGMSALMAFVGYSLMNLAMRKKDIEEELAKAEEMRKTDPNYKSPYEEEGIKPITWENFLSRANEWILSPWNALNDPGKGTYVYIGKDESGRGRYLRPGKQMRELFELFLDEKDHLDLGAWYKAGLRKMNPLVGVGHEMMTGYSTSGWENKELTKTTGWERELNRLKYVALHTMLPMSIVDPVDKGDTDKMWWRMAYPVSKGMGWYKGRELLEEAIRNDDDQMVNRVRRAYVLNGMSADFESAYSKALGTIRKEKAKEEGYDDKTPSELFEMASKSNDPKMREKLLEKATEQIETTGMSEGKTAREAMAEYQQKTQKEGNYLVHCSAKDMEYDTHMKIFMKKAEEDGSVVATFRKMGGTIPKKTQVKKGKKVVDSRIEWKGKDGYTNADCEKFYKEHEDELIAYYRMNMFREGYNARIKEMKDLKGKEAEAKMKEIREYRNKWMQYASEYLDTTTWKVKKHKK